MDGRSRPGRWPAAAARVRDVEVADAGRRERRAAERRRRALRRRAVGAQHLVAPAGSRATCPPTADATRPPGSPACVAPAAIPTRRPRRCPDSSDTYATHRPSGDKPRVRFVEAGGHGGGGLARAGRHSKDVGVRPRSGVAANRIVPAARPVRRHGTRASAASARRREQRLFRCAGGADPPREELRLAVANGPEEQRRPSGDHTGSVSAASPSVTGTGEPDPRAQDVHVQRAQQRLEHRDGHLLVVGRQPHLPVVAGFADDFLPRCPRASNHCSRCGGPTAGAESTTRGDAATWVRPD